jgi:DNA repair protein RecO (recombination protein O)
MECTDKALILKTGKFREYDVWVRYISASRGVQTAFAFGGSRSRKRFGGCLEPFSHVVFKVGANKTGSYQVLSEGSLIKSFNSLRSNHRKIGLAANCVKFVDSINFDNDSARRIFELLLQTLTVIDAEDPDDFFPLLFRTKVAFEQGFKPDFTICGRCGKPLFGNHNYSFDIEKGVALCVECDPALKGFAVSSFTLRTLSWIQDTDPEHWTHLHIPSEVRSECFKVMDRFMAYHLGLVWEEAGYRRV